MLKKIVSKISVCLMVAAHIPAAYAAYASPGKIWRDMSDILIFTWSDVNAVCPTDGTTCSGLLGSSDISGWIWASANEVGDLFEYGTNGAFPGGIASIRTPDTTWAPDFVSAFGATDESPRRQITYGWTSSLRQHLPDLAETAYILDSKPVTAEDWATNGFAESIGSAAASRGVWLYKVAEVPIPAAAWLFLSALGGLGILRRRQSKTM